MIYLIIAFNFVSFITYKKAHIDFDSASHLFKSINNKSYKTGYKIGIKLPVLLFYKLLLTNITKNVYFFRILNFLIINILTFIFLLKSERNIQNNFIILTLLIILNSFWINPSTSSSEMYEILILILIIHSIKTLPSLNYQLLTVGIGCVLLISLKFLNSIYLLPLYFFISADLNNLIKNLTFLLLLVFGLFVIYNSKTSITYAKNRKGLIHKKSLTFIKKNIYFSLNFLILIVFSIKIAEGFEVLFLVASLILLIIQKQYFSYFLLHISCLVLFFLLDKSFSEFDKIISILVISNIFFLFLLNIYKFFKIKNYYQLVRTLQGESVSGYLSDQEEQVRILKSITYKKSVYFIGVDIPLLINAEIYNVDNTFYNENHLTYWSGEENPKNFIINEIVEKQSEIIIISFPMAEYNDSIFEKLNYKKFKEVGSLKLFIKNN